MLLRRYLISRFYRTYLFLTLLFTAVITVSQLFPVFHLLFALPLPLTLAYGAMLLIYTLLLGAALALFPAAADLIHTLKEGRKFHILYTFGVSEKKVLRILWLAVAVVALSGAAVAPVINYQKISYITKYMKARFGTDVLLTVPPGTFFTSRSGFAFYFFSREGNRFEKVVVNIGEHVATAQRAKLEKNGVLKLQNVSLFGRENGYITWMESRYYTISLGGGTSYTLSGKKLLKNALFAVTLFLFPLVVFPLFFYTIFRRAETKFSAHLWALLFLVLQFGVALLIKALL